ncbi:PEP-CTERM sorting domain-containing protein [Gloeothece verrucosa]|uniref:PEP-CTERM protein-sorting domain-containing protein n=1 Tax=Gloeothece verrucosa (strain PCC 7822) TaxID=497965 RepID=E0UM60_GLOV7|nr:PEP-CTERM sorting domain-containing protein [Gloeothece verrucosa]ADN18040.1 conserved hypothetical protein [Gloeothece verrucosa PCC 7822]
MNTQIKCNSNYQQILKFSFAISASLGIWGSFPEKTTAAAINFGNAFVSKNWTLINTNANGSIDKSHVTSGIVILTGGNNRSNSSGITDWTIPIDFSRAGSVQFNWSYFTLDTPGFDSAGYLLNGNYTPLAVKDGEQSTSPVILTLKNGDVFGFRVATASNSDGPGELTIYGTYQTVVPEPLTILGAGTAVVIGTFFKRRIHKKD